MKLYNRDESDWDVGGYVMFPEVLAEQALC